MAISVREGGRDEVAGVVVSTGKCTGHVSADRVTPSAPISATSAWSRPISPAGKNLMQKTSGRFLVSSAGDRIGPLGGAPAAGRGQECVRPWADLVAMAGQFCWPPLGKSTGHDKALRLSPRWRTTSRLAARNAQSRRRRGPPRRSAARVCPCHARNVIRSRPAGMTRGSTEPVL